MLSQDRLLAQLVGPTWAMRHLVEMRLCAIQHIEHYFVKLAFQSRVFDVATLIAALPKMIEYANTSGRLFIEEGRNMPQAVQEFSKKNALTQDSAMLIKALATQAVLSHCGLVVESLSDRVLEYAYKSRVDFIGDEFEYEPCPNCEIDCSTSPSAIDYITAVTAMRKSAAAASQEVEEFLQKARADFEAGPKTQSLALAQARVIAGKISLGFMSIVHRDMEHARQVERTIDWTVSLTQKAVQAYADTMAASAFADAVLIWIREMDAVCCLAKPFDVSQN